MNWKMILKNLGIRLTMEPTYETERLFRPRS